MSKRQTRYVLLLDYSSGTVVKIRLTDEELKESERYEDFEDFLLTLEKKYEFRLRDCEWMSTDELIEVEYGF